MSWMPTALLALLALATTPAIGPGDPIDRRKVEALVGDFHAVLEGRDGDALRAWIDDDAIITLANGETITGQQLSQTIEAGVTRFDKFVAEVDHVVASGPATVVGSQAEVIIRRNDKIIRGRVQVTEVFVARDGRSRLIAMHFTKRP